MSLTFVAETNIGQLRQVNEDSIWPADNRHPAQPTDPYGMLFLVADGMGGHGAGDVASQIAVAEIPTHYYSEENEETTIPDRLRAAIAKAHRRIVEQSGQSVETANMGTTIVAAVIAAPDENQPGDLYLAWAGDSRAYRLRQGQLEQLTRDHSRLWPLIEAGQLSWDELHFHPHRSRITNALIARQAEPAPEIMQLPLQPGDRILLCSDGLSGEVRPEELERTLAALDQAQAASHLIEVANAPTEVYQNDQLVRVEGGTDNISVILVDIPGEPVTRAVPPVTPTEPVVVPSPEPFESTVVAKTAPSRRSPWPLILTVVLVVLLLVAGGLFFVLAGINNWQALIGDAPAGELPPQATTPIQPTPTEQNSVIIAVETDAVGSAEIVTTEPVITTTAALAEAAETRQPTVTRAAAASPTVPATATPLPPPPPSPTTVPLTTTAVISPNQAAPVLILPEFDENDDEFHDAREVTFGWEWPGELSEDLSFEIRVWLQGDNPSGVHDAKLLKQDPLFVNPEGNRYFMTLNLKGVTGIPRTSPDYLWSVGVVRIQPDYEWLGIESAPRPIRILVPDEGQTSPKTAKTSPAP